MPHPSLYSQSPVDRQRVPFQSEVVFVERLIEPRTIDNVFSNEPPSKQIVPNSGYGRD